MDLACVTLKILISAYMVAFSRKLKSKINLIGYYTYFNPIRFITHMCFSIEEAEVYPPENIR